MKSSDTATPAARFIRISKQFDGTPVLDKFSLDIAETERVTLIGPSGSGKSTALRILMTLEQPDSGELYIEGESVWDELHNGRKSPANERHIRRLRGKVGMVFQDFNLFPHMNVMRNVTEGPVHVLGLSRREANERARELLEMVGLSAKIDAWPGELSGGQQQRVAIARTLAMQPRILIFDEPTSALDPEMTGEVLGVIRKLADKHQFTMLIATHEMGFAREISDRICLLHKGTILESAAPDVFFTSPREARTREFLSSITGSA